MQEATKVGASEPFYVVFDGPPSNESGRFVEVETAEGRGLARGEWTQRGEYWLLGPFVEATQRDALLEALENCAAAFAEIANMADYDHGVKRITIGRAAVQFETIVRAAIAAATKGEQGAG